MPDENSRSEYLGDGVHAQYLPTQGQLWLMVERCDNPLDSRPAVRIERVCLEREVFDALVRFAGQCWPEGGP